MMAGATALEGSSRCCRGRRTAESLGECAVDVPHGLGRGGKAK